VLEDRSGPLLLGRTSLLGSSSPDSLGPSDEDAELLSTAHLIQEWRADLEIRATRAAAVRDESSSGEVERRP
jgi:hypothetical protein